MSVRILNGTLRAAVAVAAAAVGCGAQSARAAEACAQPVTPVAIVLSGGVSLGAYQAGFLAYADAYFRENRDLFKPRLIAGASAGGLNALLATLAFCAESEKPLQTNLLYGSWIDLRLSDLARAEPRGDPRGTLSTKGIERAAAAAGERWKMGLARDCDLVIGATAARLRPARIAFPGGLTVARQTERFTLRVRGLGPGRIPRLTNYVNPAQGVGEALLALPDGAGDGTRAQAFDALRDLLEASAAFPLAFAPRTVRFCTADPAADRWLHSDPDPTCGEREIEEAEFVDGGALENKPLTYAEKIESDGLAPACGGGRWRELPFSGRTGAANSTLFIYMDLRASAYPSSDSGPLGQRRLGPYAAGLVKDFLGSEQDKDLLAALENRPRMAEQVAAPRNYWPRASESLFGFAGFADRDFRRYDFYLGMEEAKIFFAEKLAPALRRGSTAIAARAKIPDATARVGWEPMICLEDLLNGGAGAACAKLAADDRSRLEALAQASVTRLASNCERAQIAGDAPGRLNDDGCARLAAAQNRARGLDAPAFRRAGLRQANDESDLAFQLRILAMNDYAYPELNLSKAQSTDAGAVIKSRVIDQFNAFADRQPASADGAAVRIAAPAAFDLIEPFPSLRQAYVASGSATDAGASWLLKPSWSIGEARGRVNLGLRIDGVDRAFSSWARAPSTVALAGVEWEPAGFSAGFWRMRFGARAGWRSQFDGESRGSSGCARGDGGPFDCEGLVVEPTASALAFDRLMLRASLESMPFASDGGSAPVRLVLESGLAFYF